jgi:methylmalonyl-CoA mutase N-terminal domain/subunit
MMLRFHAQTAGSTLAAAQPLNNVIRTTVEALAAVLGGAQSLHTNAYDEALALPTETSAKLALRTQQILAHESGVADVVDPFAGSYAVESLTTEIEIRAAALIARIDALGGMVAAIEAGFPQGEIERSAYQYQRDVEERRRIIVGGNEFVGGEEGAGIGPLHRLDPALEQAQIERLQRFRDARDQRTTSAALAALAAGARGGANLVALTVAAVKARASLGEIADELRGVFGQHH